MWLWLLDQGTSKAEVGYGSNDDLPTWYKVLWLETLDLCLDEPWAAAIPLKTKSAKPSLLVQSHSLSMAPYSSILSYSDLGCFKDKDDEA